MANFGRYKDRNANLRTAGIGYPTAQPSLNNILSMPTESETSTYEHDFLPIVKNIEKTEMCELGVNRHLTEIKGAMQGPYTYLGESHPGKLKRKYPLGKAPHPELPSEWDANRPFGMKVERGYNAAQVLDGQGRMTSELSRMPKLGKAKHRDPYLRLEPNQTFGIPTPSDPRGGLMWELFAETSNQEDEVEEEEFL